MFCRWEIGKLRRRRTSDETFPRTVFVSMETPEEGGAHIEELWPGAPCISDPQKTLYRAFGIGRASLLQVLNPGLWISGFKAFRDGSRQQKATADTDQMPGMFLLLDGRVAWRHEYAHVGDRADLAAIPRRT
ncbi:MAG: AhpC/TSA family protein [Planctomycetota bacterium]|jgi:hypothetical protein